MWWNIIKSNRYREFRRGDKVITTDFIGIAGETNCAYPGEVRYIVRIRIYEDDRVPFFVLSTPNEVRKDSLCRLNDVYARYGQFKKA